MVEQLLDPKILEAQRQMLADSSVAAILVGVLSTPEFLSHHSLADIPPVVAHVDSVGYSLASKWSVDTSSGYMAHYSEAGRDLHEGVSIRSDTRLGRLIVGGTPVYSVDPNDRVTLEAIIREVCLTPAVSIRRFATDPID